MSGTALWGRNAEVFLLPAVIACALRLAYFAGLRLDRHLTLSLLWILIDLSIFSVLGLTEVANISKVDSNASRSAIVITLWIGLILLAACVALKVMGGRRSPRPRGAAQRRRSLSGIIIVAAAVVLFALGALLSVTSYYLGISIMGVAPRELPFRLTGLLNTARLYLMPVMFLIVCDVAYETSRRVLAVSLALTMAWAVVEAAVRLSKGVVLETAVLVAILLLFRQVRPWRVGVFLLAIAVPGILLYGIVDAARIATIEGSRVVTITQVSVGADGRSILQEAGRALGRALPNGLLLAKCVDYFGDDIWRPRLSEIMEAGSPAAYNTHVIDRVPNSAVHSSGSASLAGALMVGGPALAVVLGLMFAMLAAKLDQTVVTRRCTPLFAAYAAYFMMKMFNEGVLNYLMSPGIATKLQWPAAFALIVLAERVLARPGTANALVRNPRAF
jgi:hypothetical protein